MISETICPFAAAAIGFDGISVVSQAPNVGAGLREADEAGREGQFGDSGLVEDFGYRLGRGLPVVQRGTSWID